MMAPPGGLSQAQAARCAGVSRTQIHRLVKSGGLSVERTDDGAILIEPSELLRVYPHADLGRARAPGNRTNRPPYRRGRNTPESEASRRETELLRERVRSLEADKAHLRGEIDRLLGVLEQQQRLLADQRQRPARPRRAWWRRLWSGDGGEGR